MDGLICSSYSPRSFWQIAPPATALDNVACLSGNYLSSSSAIAHALVAGLHQPKLCRASMEPSLLES
ncbi:hypothetical protein SeMB42_g02060 [Synchytrium endobioticum]|uniref:Uncharacterized protein n=1 Tax=Synchytrium endobioticum TaxID=286115 RepID=A0A507DHZ3_9FUNG|nr:hypothetical protein SeLEV6574_g01998 [Synchytrium endobioticum]TPX50935.1 hypothetical protein SeMB42_g02060 [Synchytrium endobioticum]